MLTLDKYCERRIKGKSVKQLQREIELLRAKIYQLESGNDDLDPISAHYFRRKNKMDCKIHILNRRRDCAIKALVEAGGLYIPTTKECEAIAFNKSLDMVKYIIFDTSYGNFGYRTEVMIVNDDNMVVAVRGNGCGIGDGYTYEVLINKTELIEKLRDLHMNEWRRSYYAPVLDGTSWMIVLVSPGYKEIARFKGSNEWPYNFNEFEKIFSRL